MISRRDRLDNDEMARPRTHDDFLRGRLLEQAGQLVSGGGPDALSLRRLAAHADTSTTAVYSLFGNKDGLLRELFREAADRFAARLAKLSPSGDPVDDLLRMALLYRQYALANPRLYATILAGPVAEEGVATALCEPLCAMVLRAQAEGGFGTAPAEHIALSCWATAHGLVSLELTGNLPAGLNLAGVYEGAMRAAVLGWAGRSRV